VVVVAACVLRIRAEGIEGDQSAGGYLRRLLGAVRRGRRTSGTKIKTANRLTKTARALVRLELVCMRSSPSHRFQIQGRARSSVCVAKVYAERPFLSTAVKFITGTARARVSDIARRCCANVTEVV